MYAAFAYASPVGRLILASGKEGLAGLWIEGQKYFGAGIAGQMDYVDAPTGVLRQTISWLDRYFAGARPSPEELPLAPVGSLFRQEVWRILREIPYGEVTTYGEIARQMAAFQGTETMSAQAVGGAVGHNPISIIIPCHRVVGADGSLTGYAGGIPAKQWLLALEGVDVTRFSIPGGKRERGGRQHVPHSDH